MYRINNKDFKILTTYKEFLDQLDRYLANVPRNDIYYKDLIRDISIDLLEIIVGLDKYEEILEIEKCKRQVKAKISLIDFLIDRFYSKGYISEGMCEKLALNLVNINKMVNGWIKSIIDDKSENVWLTMCL